MGQQIYLGYAHLFSWIGGLFLLLMTLVLSLGLHYLILDYGVSASTLLFMILLTIPGLLFVVIPFSAIFASITLFHRLSQNNELIVMRSVGFDTWRMIKPIALIGLVLALFGWVNALWLVPLSSQTFNKINRSFRHQEIDVTIKAEKFNHLGENIMLYARAITPDNLYQDVLVAIQEPDGSGQTLIAQTGQFNQDFNSPGFLLRHGTSQGFDAKERELQVTEFDSYQLKLAEKEIDEISYWMKSSERYLPDLLLPDITNSTDRSRYDELVTKGHDRLITPVFFFLLPMLASLFMILAPFDRRAFFGKIFSSALLCFGVYILHRISLNMAASSLGFLAITYGILLATIIAVIVLLQHKRPLPIDLIALAKTVWMRHRPVTRNS